MLDDIRNLLLIIPAIFALIGGIGKVSHNLFIETVKYKYKRVPDKQSNIGIMLSAILGVAAIIDLLALIALFISFINNPFNNICEENINIGLLNIGPFAFVLLLMMIWTLIIFFTIRLEYIEKLSKNKYKKK